ncbi:hypothetical protein ACFLWS_08410 [Chloroflexota bacterium]
MKGLTLVSWRRRRVLLVVTILVGTVLGLLLAGCTAKTPAESPETKPAPTVTTDRAVVPFEAGAEKSKEEVVISGSGFEPGIEVLILLPDSWGNLTNIGVLVDDSPIIVNEDGTFEFAWKLDRWTRQDVGGAGLFSLQVVDTDFNTLATTPLELRLVEQAAD